MSSKGTQVYTHPGEREAFILPQFSSFRPTFAPR